MPRHARRAREAGWRAKLVDFQKADVIIDLGGGSLVGAGEKLTVEESERALEVMRALVESQVAVYDAEAHPASPDE